METISTLSELLEKLLDRISTDLESTLVNLDGNLKDIVNGTHIKIPMDVGYVNFYKLPNSYEISIWLKNNLTDLTPETLDNLNKNEELNTD